MRVYKLTFAALAVAASLSLTACNDDGGTAQSDPSSGSTAASSAGGSDSGSGSSSGAGSSDQSGGKASGGNGSGGQDSAGKGSGGQGGTGAGSGSQANGKGGTCRTDDLKITAIDSTIDGDADRTVAVEMKNNGGKDCAMSGYAGVDLKTDSGSLSATRTGEKAPSIVLKSGESISFGINYPVNKSGGSGVRITGLVVTPPNQTKSVTLEWPGADSLPVTEGGGSSVKVGPIGSAGQGG